jgi:hypothetical protein
MFATELLMPWKLIDPLVNGGQHGFDVVKLLADRCGSSLLASAIRYTEVTKECLAVIVSHEGVVEFMTASEPFRTGAIGWLHRGDQIPTSVPTNRLAKDKSWIAASEVVQEGAHLDDWFESAPHIEVEEDIIGLGSYGRVLLYYSWTGLPRTRLKRTRRKATTLIVGRQGAFANDKKEPHFPTLEQV